MGERERYREGGVRVGGREERAGGREREVTEDRHLVYGSVHCLVHVYGVTVGRTNTGSPELCSTNSWTVSNTVSR